jgi:multiple sugar transport system permease protein
MQRLRFGTSIAVVAIFMFPLVWWVLTSFKSNATLYSLDGYAAFRFSPTLENYEIAFLGLVTEALNARVAILNSLVITSVSTLISIAIAAPAAFGLSQTQAKLQRSVLIVVLFWRVVPSFALLIPLFTVYRVVGLLDTFIGLVLAEAALNLPFAILVLKSFFDEVPHEVAEAAKIDGATPFQLFSKIYVPLLRSGIIATTLLCFVFAWTEFLAAQFLAGNISVLPTYLLNIASFSWTFVTAVGTVAFIPCFIIMLFGQRFLTRAFTWGFQTG